MSELTATRWWCGNSLLSSLPPLCQEDTRCVLRCVLVPAPGPPAVTAGQAARRSAPRARDGSREQWTGAPPVTPPPRRAPSCNVGGWGLPRSRQFRCPIGGVASNGAWSSKHRAREAAPFPNRRRRCVSVRLKQSRCWCSVVATVNVAGWCLAMRRTECGVRVFRDLVWVIGDQRHFIFAFTWFYSSSYKKVNLGRFLFSMSH